VKLFAVLKDSFREAIDAKVFYVMIGMSALLIILVGSVSFQPEPAEKMMQIMTLSLNGDFLEMIQGGPSKMPKDGSMVFYEIKSAEPVDGEPGTPDSKYQVRVRARYSKAEDAAKMVSDPQPLLTAIEQRFGALDESFRLYTISDARVVANDDANPAVPTVTVDFIATPTTAARRVWPHRVTVFYGAWPWSSELALPLGLEIYVIEDKLVNGFGAWVAIIISIVISAMFIPNMLRKGTIDLLLVKPISRPILLIYKYLGGLIFIFLNTSFIVVGIWVVLGLRSGVWATGFLLSIPIITFFFAILYAVSALFGVLSRSAIVSILMTCLVWFGLWGVGEAYITVESFRTMQEAGTTAALPFKIEQKVADTWWFKGIKVVHFVLPRTRDLDHLTKRYLIRDLLTANQVKTQKIDPTDIHWGETIAVSLVFISIMLGLSCWRFSTRDY
jgi:ABC-type transport system involved in multi-copper enzyme maturation permease subunit